MSAIKTVLQERRVFAPSGQTVAGATVSGMDAYKALCAEAERDYEGFWARLARETLTWQKPFTKVLDESKAPFYTWFEDGELNASYNSLDRHVEAGNGERVAIVFEADDGTVVGEATGAVGVASTFSTVVLYDDGTPHTRHVITNPIVEIDEAAGTALCRYYITVFQRADGFPLQPVWANRYEDRLRRVGGTWRLERRRGFAHLPGDTSHHLRDVPDF